MRTFEVTVRKKRMPTMSVFFHGTEVEYHHFGLWKGIDGLVRSKGCVFIHPVSLAPLPLLRSSASLASVRKEKTL
jgi:hypothetical protein